MSRLDRLRIRRWFDLPASNDLAGYQPSQWIKTDVPTEGKWYVRRDEWIASRPDDPLRSPVAYIAADTFGGDRIAEGIFTPAAPFSMTLLYRVGPRHLGRGYSTATIRALLDHPAAADISEFRCTVAQDNEPSRRAALGAGFTIDHAEVIGGRKKDLLVFRRLPESCRSATVGPCQ
ncbi:GNAT family N-acetyltransferase [Nocardia cyriacigeorgica]|uniref:GNAT family N-acetyltransferase n=2 Tax=Nocardia cyriacigeorgica TaxID=135487 RepID=A0A6P1DEV7_9NOCA|nr:GNAT family N-acetyltransferase [Nocardia cyriacigeorgica]NEW48029.1 GNAT family N-acetyltransferase [Nocardia cyriacigeorgica]